MQKKLSSLGLLFLSLLVFVSCSVKAFAMAPSLSLTANGDGDSVQATVIGDPNTSVLFFYTKSGSGQQIISIGTTDANGNLNTTISTSSYGIISGSTVYVTTSNINGPQSSLTTWPAVASMLSSNNMLSLSQTGLAIVLGQTSIITANNLNSSSIYQSNNSNPQIANFSISGSQISVAGNSYGTTTGTFCLINNTTNCGSVYVIVQNSNAQPLTFSQSSVTLSSGQTVAVQISGGSGNYTVIDNSGQNNGLITTSISGSIINLTSTSTTGSASITVCTTDMASCGIINATIGNATYSSVSFSQSNPTITLAQSLNISIFGPTNTLFYVASNSNPSIVQANVSANTLTLFGIANGSSTLSICAAATNCGSLVVTVNSNSTNGGNLTLSQSNANLSIGQTTSITISGGSMPYTIFPNTGNIFQPTLNTNILTIYGLSTGSSSMNVCSADGHCLTLPINVGSSSNTTSSTLRIGCSSTLGYSPVTGVLCNTSISTIVTVPIDCTGSPYSTSTGQACPLNTIAATQPTTVTISTPTNTIFQFTLPIKIGSTGDEVTQLEKKLKTLGFYKGKIDGGFGPMLEKSVKSFQKAHNLSQVGNVGPQTRALLNK